jgi:aryl-alcohol dehydrogenase-like predicted oxidoreductase
MQTRKIGSLTVSEVGLGCNNFGRRLDANATAGVVNAALEAGINFFDTADVYGAGQSEQYLSQALGSRRKNVIVATKFGNNMDGQGQGASPAYIQKAVEASLRRLNTDYIDLYQLHVPDAAVPIEDTLGTLDDLVKAGKVREIGCSNFTVDMLRKAEAVASAKPGSARFVSVQNEYSLFHRDDERDVLPECERTNTAYLPYFPLASGLLTGKYRKGQTAPEGTRITTVPNNYEKWLTEQNLTIVEALIKFAESRGHTLLELAFSWLLRWSSVASVIAGAMNPQQIKANVGAAGWHLSEADLAEIDSIMSARNAAQGS